MRTKAKFDQAIMRVLLIAFVIFICWSFFFVIAGENPLTAMMYILRGAFKNPEKAFSVVNKLFIYFFMALAYCIPNWTGMANVGGDGQLMVGGFSVAVLALFLQTDSKPVNIVIALLVAAIGGGLWALWPALLRVHFGINEVVTTLLGNYIVTHFTDFMISSPLRVRDAAVYRTEYIPDNFKFPVLTRNLSSTIILVIIMLVIVELFRKKTIAGYQFMVTGKNEFLARQGGMNTKRIQIGGMVVGGAIAGVAGGLITLSMYNCFITGFSSDLGTSGMLVALIAGCIPWLSVIIGSIFSILQVGAIELQMFTQIPSEITGVLQSILVFIIAAGLALQYRKKAGGKK